MIHTVHIVPFDALTPHQLYAMLALRSRVFVMEQGCLYLDPDGLDIDAMHILLEQEGNLAGYTRLLRFPGGADMSFGRVVTDPAYRGKGLGKTLVSKALAWLGQNHPGVCIRITAQLYLEAFYSTFGFVAEGDAFDMDGIDHIRMVRYP